MTRRRFLQAFAALPSAAAVSRAAAALAAPAPALDAARELRRIRRAELHQAAA
jgi:hypothetical protein